MDLVNAVKLEVERKKTASRPNATKHFGQNAYLGRVKNANLAAKAYFIIVTLWHCGTWPRHHYSIIHTYRIAYREQRTVWSGLKWLVPLLRLFKGRLHL